MAHRKAVWCIYSLLKGRTVHFTDRKQDLRPAWGPWKAAQKVPQEGFSMYFLSCFMVLLRQLRRLYTSGSIFQVPPVYNYSTCCTDRVLTRLIHRVRVYAFVWWAIRTKPPTSKIRLIKISPHQNIAPFEPRFYGGPYVLNSQPTEIRRLCV